ncbi:hypothetical protein BDZ97DRAFT_1613158, partial [Flammula alnicola]
LSQDPANEEVFKRLFEDPSFIRIARVASGAFATWVPELYNYYAEHMDALLSDDPSLKMNFPSSIWASATVNFGPKTACFKHMDSGNLPCGLCGITALGDYDPVLGGHLVLWQLKLVIQFPLGSTILIPSASISHSNVAIRPGERR